MNDNSNLWLAALAGAVVGATVATLVNSEQGKQVVERASTSIKDFASQATEYAKNNIPGIKTAVNKTQEQVESV